MQQRINQTPLPLVYDPIEKFPWINMNQKEMNTHFGYMPFVLTGEFDHASEVLVKTPRLGKIIYEIF